MMEIKRDMRNECHHCKHRREVPGNAHIKCVKPDPDMVGTLHGIKNGWFMYPLLFDPTWKEKFCVNYEDQDQVQDAVNRSISQPVSRR